MVKHKSKLFKSGHFRLFDVAFLGSIEHAVMVVLGIDAKESEENKLIHL